MYKVIVLGAGMVGSAIARDLAQKHKVTLTDVNSAALEKAGQRIETRILDVTDTRALREAVAPFDLVVSAVPGALGYRTLHTVIEAGRDIVDISFFPENALDLHDLAVKNGVTAVVDCGVAPGMGNLLLGYHDARMTVTAFECLVGGLPAECRWPFSYKAPFSPADVIEEYVRPARLVENGRIVAREALSEPEMVDFDGIGTLESFNTDGLRTLIHTMPHIPDMKEKTLRYPGHIEYIRVLRACGFFSGEKVRVDDGTEVAPLALTSKLLFDQWRLGEEEEEFTVMRVTIEGSEEDSIKDTDASTLEGSVLEDAAQAPGSARKRITYDLLDRYCPKTRTSSMARTTGYTATAVANLLLEKRYGEKGIIPPELIGRDDASFNYIMDYLTERGINLTST
jgi:lysine 6-dehydrogenase